MKEADRNKEAAAAARWYYSSPLVRKAREELLSKILVSSAASAGHGPTADAEYTEAPASPVGAENGSIRRLSDLCLENIAATLKRYDVAELRGFIQIHLEPSQLLRIAVYATKLHTLDDENIAAVTAHLASTVVCPRDFTHVGLHHLLRCYHTNAFVLHDDWEQADVNTLDLHKLAGPRELFVIGSALKVASFSELRSIFPLEQLTLHAVALPPDLPRLSTGSVAAGNKYMGTTPDKLEVLHKIREYDLGSEDDYSNLLVPGGSNPFVMPSAGADAAEAQLSAFACAAVLCTLFLTASCGSAAGESTSKKSFESSLAVNSAFASAAASSVLPSGAKGFENLRTLTFCHCKWGWTIESLLLFAYRLSASQEESTQADSGKGTSLSNLKCITIKGVNIFKPPAGSATISHVDACKLQRACAVFHAICSVQLVVDGVACAELGGDGGK